MSLLRPVGRFLRRRAVLFWLTAPVLVFLIFVFSIAYPGDRTGERVARQLDGAIPVRVDQVFWRVDDGYVATVAVVVPDATGAPFILDLTGVEGDDKVSSHGGWQPSHADQDGPRYQPGLLVRYDLAQRPPIGMAEIDRGRLRDGTPSRLDLIVVVVASLLLAVMLGFMVRRDVVHASPRRQMPFHKRLWLLSPREGKRRRPS